MQEHQSEELQEEINALKRQMRQLLEVVALVQQRAPQPAGEQSLRAPEQPENATSTPSGRTAEVPLSTIPVPTGSEEIEADTAWIAALIDENRRLGDLARMQAEELGAL